MNPLATDSKHDKKKKFSRGYVLKLAEMHPDVISYYEDLQADYKAQIAFWHALCPIGYSTKNDAGKFDIHTPKESETFLQNSFPDFAPIIQEFIALVLAGGKEASSSYNVFASTYKPNGAKFGKTREEALEKIKAGADALTAADKLKNDPIYDLIIKNFDSLKSLSVEAMWNLLKKQIDETPDGKKRQLGFILREKLGITCKRPTDVSYCRALATAVFESLRSQFEKSKLYVEETAALVKQFDETLPNIKFYDIICRYADELEKEESGLTKNMLFDRGRPSYINDAFNESPKEVFQAYELWKLQEKILRRKERGFPLRPDFSKDVKIRFGLTGLPPFSITESNQRIVVELLQHKLQCFQSKQCNNLKVSPSKNGFDVSFTNAFDHQGLVKEIGLLSKNGSFYITLFLSISHPNTNFLIANFFRTADGDSSGLPDEIRSVAYDLNISNPVCGTQATAVRHGNGSLQVLDYGTANVVKPPYILCIDGPYSTRLMKLRNDAYKLVSVIRELKKAKKKDEPLSETTIEVLSKIKAQSDHPRVKVNAWMACIKKETRKLQYLLRQTGYNNVADSIRLIAALDAVDAATQSLERIDLKEGEIRSRIARENKTQRFSIREQTSRRIASAIAKDALEANANVVFVEDLESKFDSDLESRKNSLARLFGAGLLLKYIEEALEKVGIGFVKVDKNGTSKTDAVTGLVGHRNYFDKEKLWVIRNNRIGWINSDLNASLNVLIRGLTHSVCPYRITVNNGKQKEEEGRKRKKKFFGTPDPKFFLDAKGKLRFHQKQKANVQYLTEVIYCYGPEFITQKEHYRQEQQIEQQIKDIPSADRKNMELDVSPKDLTHYKNYSVQKDHD